MNTTEMIALCKEAEKEHGGPVDVSIDVEAAQFLAHYVDIEAAHYQDDLGIGNPEMFVLHPDRETMRHIPEKQEPNGR